MKHLYTMLLALGISSFCAIGQNVTVMMKDGTTHKFNADYVSEITFRDVVPQQPAVEFGKLLVEPYSNGNATMTFESVDGTKLVADIYGPGDATFLHEGKYLVDGSKGEFTIDPAYSSVTLDGKPRKITDGSMTVTLAGKTYSFNAELTLDDGSQLNGTYSGTPGTYTPWIDCVLSQASYNENQQLPGDFYIKFNDADWAYEMAVVFTADSDAAYLPAGKYTYSETRMPGTISPRSYVDAYKPYATLRLMEGSAVSVTVEGDNYIIDMALNLSDGRTADFRFKGSISGTPAFSEPEKVSGQGREAMPFIGTISSRYSKP